MWIDTNDCPEHFHELKRTDEGIEAFHLDDTRCEEMEFDVSELS